MVLGRWRSIAFAFFVLCLAASCTGGSGVSGSTDAPTSEPWHGGTLRLALLGDLWWGLDPQKAYSPVEFEFMRCCLLRTLFSYNGLPASEGGAEARPDLAAGPADVSGDGLTWTIGIRSGINYAPPLEDVEITAADFVRALMREASPSGTYTAYPFDYSVIEGFDAYRAGEAETITGLETPDEHTLVVRVTEPAGDLPYRLALAASAPIPPNPDRPEALLGAAEGHDRGYGRFLVASGPYMIEGSEALDLSLAPKQQEPIAGFTPSEQGEPPGTVLAPGSLTLVRNPSWDPATDALRAAYADRIEVQLRGEWYTGSRSTRAELAAAVEAGSIDHVSGLDYTRAQIRRYRADPDIADNVTTQPTGGIYYLTMNLAVPPFDDLHVRRAVALAIDDAELVRTVATLSGDAVPATHLGPDQLEAGLLAGYDPYPTNLAAARGEMARSRYDRDRDGVCDRRECDGILALANAQDFGSAPSREVAEWLRAIGIGLRVDVEPWGRFYRRVGDEREQVALTMGWNWACDYPNASTFLGAMFASSGIETTQSPNTSLLGATRSQLRRWGYEVTQVPSADDRVDRCMATTGLDQTECWADLDRYLMERVVPVVPYLASARTFVLSERVASYSYTLEMATVLAFDRIALVPGSD